jgi:hypothetical protein
MYHYTVQNTAATPFFFAQTGNWSTYIERKVLQSVFIPAGTHVLRFTTVTAGLNVKLLSFHPSDTVSDSIGQDLPSPAFYVRSAVVDPRDARGLTLNAKNANNIGDGDSVVITLNVPYPTTYQVLEHICKAVVTVSCYMFSL